MSGREVTPDRVTATDTVDGAGGGGGAQQPWKTALAVILPVLAVALLAYQVSGCCCSRGTMGLSIFPLVQTECPTDHWVRNLKLLGKSPLPLGKFCNMTLSHASQPQLFQAFPLQQAKEFFLYNKQRNARVCCLLCHAVCAAAAASCVQPQDVAPA